MPISPTPAAPLAKDRREGASPGAPAFTSFQAEF